MAKVTEIRLTLAALIYAIEIDLKKIITKWILPSVSDLSFLQDKDLIQRVKSRFNKEFPGINPDSNLQDAIDFIDYQDCYTIMLKNKDVIPNKVIVELARLTGSLNNIAPIRNRVMHTRPLNVGDFSTVWAFLNEIELDNSIDWSTVRETKGKIESDPSYVLTLSIPSFQPEIKESFHNLPIPDFDETGYIGRRKDIDTVKKLILGNNRVVSIIGDGGIGKTALALKVAYDILDLGESNPFDMILWITAKSTMLTVSGIEEIKTTIRDFTGVVKEISSTIGIKEKLQEVLDYLEVFDTLLIIDNLETILDEPVRDFIREAQMHSKIMITSRIGLGELEFRYPLKGLSEIESIQLIRQYSNIKQSEILNKLENSKLNKVASKLHYNPLALKWFVNSVETGITPDEVLRNTDNLLNFCLTNVYQKLSLEAKNILKTILAARRSLNDAQLVFLTGMPSLQLRKCLNELFATTLIAREIVKDSSTNSQEITYQIPDFAKEYLLKKYPIDATFVKEINSKLKKLFQTTSVIRRQTDYNEFGLNAISIRNTNEKVTARLITEALRRSKNGDFERAITKLDEAKSILPNYSEIYRVSAFIKATNGDILGAEQDYKLGLEIEPDNPRLLYFYSGFLLYQLDDVTGALSYASKLHEIRPKSEYPTFLFARCLSTSGKNEDAINLIETLINDGSLNQINLRIAFTDLISMYAHWGVEFIQKEGDFNTSIQKFLQSFKIFEYCYSRKNFDGKMIKNFCSSLKLFIKNIPKMHASPYLSQIKDLFIKYDDQIALNQSKSYLHSIFSNQYDMEISATIAHFEGTMEFVNHSENYAFILKTDGNKLYAHKRAFKYPNDFFAVKKGTKVIFDIGSNKQGPCATNVQLSNTTK